jgi:tetratricopeptide (TPR) repeat protein
MAGFGSKKSQRPKPSSQIHPGAKSLEAAVKRHKEGALEAAEKLYKKALESGFTHPIAISNLAVIYKQTGRRREAISCYKKAISIHPEFADAHANLATLLEEMGEFESALAASRRAIELDPGLANPHATLGAILLRQGHLDAAIGASRRALELDPGLADAHLTAGLAWMRQGNLDEALHATLRAIQLQPDLAEAHLTHGGILLQQGQFGQAHTAILKTIELQPQHARAHLNLGGILMAQGRLEEARQAAHRALELKPELSEAHMLLSGILQQQGLLDEALAANQKAISLQPDQADAHIMLAGLLQELNQLDQAMVAARRAIELKPDSALGHYCLGRLQKTLGDLAGGKQSLRTALALDPQETATHFELSQDLASDTEANSLLKAAATIARERLTLKKLIWLLFAQANCNHRLGDHARSAELLAEANRLRLTLMPSNREVLIRQIRQQQSLTDPRDRRTETSTDCRAIFIVGMPRSGSTLLESILSTNPDTISLGESRAMPAAIACLNNAAGSAAQTPLMQLYRERLETAAAPQQVSIDKQLYNFIHVDVIATELAEARIIHCRRNPLDCILSMFRANLNGNQYTASLADCAEILIEQELAMRAHKSRHPDRITTFQYETAVRDPETEIRRLVQWLGWTWAAHYLEPEKSKRRINTASVIQARQPLHGRSVGGWRHYTTLLEPARRLLSESGLFSPHELGLSSAVPR